MEKAFIIVIGEDIDLNDVTALLDKRSEITDWFTGIPNSVFAIGKDVTAKQIGRWIRDQLGMHRYFVTEITADNGGWLPRSYWAKLP